MLLWVLYLYCLLACWLAFCMRTSQYIYILVEGRAQRMTEEMRNSGEVCKIEGRTTVHTEWLQVSQNQLKLDHRKLNSYMNLQGCGISRGSSAVFQLKLCHSFRALLIILGQQVIKLQKLYALLHPCWCGDRACQKLSILDVVLLSSICHFMLQLAALHFIVSLR